jgi:hypothetical protein
MTVKYILKNKQGVCLTDYSSSGFGMLLFETSKPPAKFCHSSAVDLSKKHDLTMEECDAN